MLSLSGTPPTLLQTLYDLFPIEASASSGGYLWLESQGDELQTLPHHSMLHATVLTHDSFKPLVEDNDIPRLKTFSVTFAIFSFGKKWREIGSLPVCEGLPRSMSKAIRLMKGPVARDKNKR
jgi:hypothetical protein